MCCGGITGQAKCDSLALRHRRGRRLYLRHLLPIQTGEIDRIEQEWREAAVANGGGNNFAREREEQSWTLDQHEWIKTFLWDVANAKHAGELQFKTEE
jgi:hypothetical protein